MFEDSYKNQVNYLKKIIDFVKRKLHIIAIITISISLIIASYLYIIMDDTYEATSSMIVEVSEIDSEYTNLIVAKQLVSTYKEFAVSSKVLNEVNKNLGLNYTHNQIRNMVTINTISGTIIINIVVSNQSALQAKIIANEIIQVIEQLDKEYLGTDSIDILDYANLPMNPANESRLLYMVLGVLLSLGISIMLVLLYGFVNDKIETEDQVEESLGINSLGKILDYKYVKEITNKKTPIVVKDYPDSCVSEEYHRIRSRIDLNGLDNKIKTINLISANPNEGKTTATINLAEIYSESNLKTLIIDLDIYTDSIRKVYSLQKHSGLTDYFENNIDIENYIINIHEHLDFIQGGQILNVLEEVLLSDKFKTLMDELKLKYDKIIIDCPPLNAFLEGELVSINSDATIFVVGSKMTEVDNAKNIMRNLSNLKANVIGAIITRAHTLDLKDFEKNYYKIK